MNKKDGFGIVDLLLGLVVMSVIFAMMMPMLKNFGGGGGSSLNRDSAEKKANEMIQEIETMRQQLQQIPVDSD